MFVQMAEDCMKKSRVEEKGREFWQAFWLV
jgi:hypothetical protein